MLVYLLVSECKSEVTAVSCENMSLQFTHNVSHDVTGHGDSGASPHEPSE